MLLFIASCPARLFAASRRHSPLMYCLYCLSLQFFLLYKSAHHLDYKHTVFGHVVGGESVLHAHKGWQLARDCLAFWACKAFVCVYCTSYMCRTFCLLCFPCTPGFDVLTAMEKVPTDGDDRPLQVGLFLPVLRSNLVFRAAALSLIAGFLLPPTLPLPRCHLLPCNPAVCVLCSQSRSQAPPCL